MPQLVDAYNRPVLSARAYEGAGQGGRFAGLPASNASATSAVVGNAETLRGRSHQLLRNNPWAFNGIESAVANAVGTGITPYSQHPDPDVRRTLHETWRDHVPEADAAGITTMYGLQWQGWYAVQESGECFVRRRLRRQSDGLLIPVQYQMLEPDHVPLWLNRIEPSGNITRAGIEFNAIGQRVAYHMYSTHPGDRFSTVGFAGNFQTVRVPASQVMHMFVARRPGAIRGEPILSRVLLRLAELDQFDDAELVRKKTAALFAAFIRQADDLVPIEQLSGQQAKRPAEMFDITLEPARVQYLKPNEDISFSEPADVGSNFDAFVTHELRGVAAGINAMFEQVTGNLTDVNFSSIRAGLMEFRRKLSAYVMHWLCHQFCKPTWDTFIREGIVAGSLPYLADYARDPRPFHRVRWIPDGFEYVNPVQEATAVERMIRSGVTSRGEENLKRGILPEELDAEVAADNARADAAGNVYTSDARQGVR